jgi:hypothetical protein
MEQVVREADDHAVDLGEPRVNRLGRIEQPAHSASVICAGSAVAPARP